MTDYNLRRIDPTDIELSTCPTCKNNLEKNIAITIIGEDVKTDNYYCIYCENIWVKDLIAKNQNSLKISSIPGNKITIKNYK